MKTTLLVILITISGVFAADWIKPDDLSVSKTEGESVTLTCTYDSSDQYVRLYWYRQYPNRALQYLLLRGARSWSGDHTADSRFESTASESSTDLTVTVRLADTALYYCALRVRTRLGGSGTSTDALTFGKPISLQVNPKDDSPKLPPQLSILSGTKDGPKMCLAAGFFPKEGPMSLTLEDGNSEQRVIDNAALSKRSTYYYAGTSSQSIEKCEMQGVKAPTKGEGKAPPEENKQDKEIPTCKSPTDKAKVPNSTIDPKANAMSLIVTAVRILLAKAVAVNVLMTIKAFLV